MARRIGWICLAFSLVAFFAETTEAQIWHAPARAVQAPLRYLGHGNGHGYHHCNPGPDSSYYNPWTEKNSFLISKSPQFLARYGNELHRSPMEILRHGDSSWAQQQRYGYQTPASTYPAATPLNADFVPATRNFDTDEEREGEQDDSGGDFQPSSSDEEVEDRFEEEADSIDNSDEDEQIGGIGGFDSLKESANASGEAAVLLTPSGLFRPASHSGR